MLFRFLMAFIVIALGTAGLLHLIAFTNYLDTARVKFMAKNCLLLAAGVTVATIVLGILVALTS